MRKKVIIANLTSCKITQTAGLYQYDYGQELNIIGTGINTETQVHFSNGGDALIVLAEPDGDTLVANIPDELLEAGGTITAYIYYTDETSGQTVYKVIIPVIDRAKPEDYTPTPHEKTAIEEAIAALEKNLLTVSTKETDDGTELTITDRNGNHIINIVNGEDGLDGVGIESITTEESPESGGINTITITMTDETEYTFEVRNGKDGKDGKDGLDGKDGKDGENGKDGNGIKSLVQTKSSTASEGINEWTATLDDDTTHTFEVRNGKAGNGIKSIEQTQTSTSPEGINEITVTLDDDQTETFEIRNGAIPEFTVTTETKPATETTPAGYHAVIHTADGDQEMDVYDGVGIRSITTDESVEPGGANVITFQLDDGTSKSVSVLNGPEYELSEADKQEIADIVIETLGSADTTQF